MAKSKEIIELKNAGILRGNDMKKESIWFQDGRILDESKMFWDDLKLGDVVVDCSHHYVSPGFIEVQINGAFGIDFSHMTDHYQEQVKQVGKKLLRAGVTSFCPTIVTSTPDFYHNTLPSLTPYDGGPESAEVLGVHIEGPFINKSKKGAHDEHLIQPISNGVQTILDTYGSLDNVKIITIAPELDGSAAVIQELNNRGIVVSLGHSASGLETAESAITSGASFLTHLFNAMTPFHHRDPGLIGLLSSNRLDKQIHYGLIADGIHTHPAALRLAYRINPKGLVLITDAIAATGLPSGKHFIGNQHIEIKDGKRAVIADTDTLCGSIATLDICVRKFYKNTTCSLAEALQCGSTHAAQLLHMEKEIGTLEYGSRADLVILDQNLNVMATFIRGECVFKAEGSSIENI